MLKSLELIVTDLNTEFFVALCPHRHAHTYLGLVQALAQQCWFQTSLPAAWALTHTGPAGSGFNFKACFELAATVVSTVIIRQLFLHLIPIILSLSFHLTRSNHERLSEMVKLLIIYLFLFSTSSTSSSVENCPLTTMIRFLITSSAQSTSNRPPITTGKRLGFTWKQVKQVDDDFITEPKPDLDQWWQYKSRRSLWQTWFLTSYFLYIYFDVFLQIVAVEVEHQVMDKVKAVTHDDKGKLVCQLGLLQKRKQWCNNNNNVFIKMTNSDIWSLMSASPWGSFWPSLGRSSCSLCRFSPLLWSDPFYMQPGCTWSERRAPGWNSRSTRGSRTSLGIETAGENNTIWLRYDLLSCFNTTRH